MKKSMSFEFAEIDGKNEMQNFLKTLNKDDSAKIFAYIFKLIELLDAGFIPKPTLSKHLNQGIFELKVSLSNRISRSFYFFESDGMIIFTHGCIKKTQKLPKSEIEKAIRIKKLYIGDKNDKR